MYSHLPSLNGLRVFEAAARHLSFKLAAKELELTPTAVSHQIRNLEAHLDIPLFIRHTRAVELTTAGKSLFDTSRQVLKQIDQTLTGLGIGNQDLNISAVHGFAALWLAQRLPYFQRRYPDIRVSISQSEQPSAQDSDIQIGRAEANDSAKMNLAEEFGIYASPAYLSRKHPHQTLMHVRRPGSQSEVSWDNWQKDHGTFRDAELIEFDREDQLLQACLAGQGLALTSSLLVSAQVEKGWLKPCLPEKVLAGPGYSIAVPTAAEGKRQVRLFLDWLEEQAAMAPIASS